MGKHPDRGVENQYVKGGGQGADQGVFSRTPTLTS